MLQYKSVDNQNIFDICLNTYGTLDLLNKLIEDNNIDNVNVNPASGQLFVWDETLTADQAVNQISQNADIIYATRFLPNSPESTTVLSGTSGAIVGGGNPTGGESLPDVVIPIPTETRKSVYIGFVSNLSPSEAIIKTLENRPSEKSNQSFIYNIDTKRYCIAYPTTWGDITSVKDQSGFEIISGFIKTAANFTNSGIIENYTIYTFARQTSVTDYTVNYIFML